MKGLEPSRREAHAPKACVSTNSTTSAYKALYLLPKLIAICAIIITTNVRREHRQMSKVATYLQGHVAGMVSARTDLRKMYATDGSILTKQPDMVIYPKNTNDIRKVMRFAWQLSEKGHTIPVSARGFGRNVTGAAITKGIVLDPTHHMNHVYEYEPKQKLIRLQPGVAVATVDNALRLHGTAIPSMYGLNASVGGVIADDGRGMLAGKYGGPSTTVSQLEVVLDTGDVIQTGRISKREYNRRLGMQGREGDIYRGIGAVLEDFAPIIDELAKSTVNDAGGYPGIVDVAGKGGSIDLTPLFIGSQGTLGIITEMILRAEYLPSQLALGVAAFSDEATARDAVDLLFRHQPAVLEYYDARFFAESLKQGNSYQWLFGKDSPTAQTVLLFGFDEHGERVRAKKLQKAAKALQQADCTLALSTQLDAETILSVRDVVAYAATPSTHIDHGSPVLGEYMYVPDVHLDEFVTGLRELEKKLHVELPLYGSALGQLYTVRPQLSLQKVGDKQKALKIIGQLTELVLKAEGSLVGAGGEGRLLSRFVRSTWSDELQQLHDAIKDVFDPHRILNPDSKSNVELKSLVADLRSDNFFG